MGKGPGLIRGQALALRAVGRANILWIGALLTVVGLAVAAASPIASTHGPAGVSPHQLAGGVIVLLGWAALAWGIHRFGRQSDGEPNVKTAAGDVTPPSAR
jgi:hypothetical protein